MFVNNGYRPAFIDKIRTQTEIHLTSAKITTVKPKQIFLSLNSGEITLTENKKLIKNVNLFHNKDSVPNNTPFNIIYKLQSEQCNSS